ncbi:MAG: sigma-54-dependent Fis family transcriptional regulator [Proteobacteria bacterium]|nr:sigma-54-dependent Fis family transcriptional regulator [Pseudomonadota bacterium]
MVTRLTATQQTAADSGPSADRGVHDNPLARPARGAGHGRTVLVIDDDLALGALLDLELRRLRFEPTVVASAEAALATLERQRFSAVLADVRLDGMSGLDCCARVVRAFPGTAVVLMTGWGTMQTAIDALRAGAFDFITKPLDLADLAVVLERALRHSAAESVTRLPHPGGGSSAFEELIGESAPMRRLGELLDRVAHTEATVLITGESGTGKELAARALHRRSARAAGRFVAINCAAMPEALLESQLFGHTRGAFTDAHAARVGLLIQANGGTLFLDEIGDMPLALQPKLLRALQERTVRPLGSDLEVPFDARVLAATHRQLDAEVQAGRFRADLFFRINVIQVQMPALRTRATDVLLLANDALRQIAARSGKAVVGISAAAAEHLLAYPWPGNVRELLNCIESAVALTAHSKIAVEDLPLPIRRGLSHPGPRLHAAGDPLVPMDEVERRHILAVLSVVGGNRTEAARVLGLDRKTLYRKLKQYARSGRPPAPEAPRTVGRDLDQ